MEDKTTFKDELTLLINKHSIENKCDMPDYLLAEMIVRIIEAVGKNIKQTLDWHGCDSVCHPHEEEARQPMNNARVEVFEGYFWGSHFQAYWQNAGEYLIGNKWSKFEYLDLQTRLFKTAKECCYFHNRKDYKKVRITIEELP